MHMIFFGIYSVRDKNRFGKTAERCGEHLENSRMCETFLC